MGVAVDSRYASGALTVIEKADGTFNVALFPSQIDISGISFRWHLVVFGDRFDTLAMTLYADPTKWWVIADINPEVEWPGDLVPGTLIRLPVTQ